VKKWHIAVIAVVVIAVALGGFFGGRAAAGGVTPSVEDAMKVLQNATPEQMQQVFANGNGVRGAFPGATGANGTNRFQGGNAVAGQIVSADSSSITVKTSDGSTRIVFVSGSTTVSKTQDGTMADLTAGQDVIVTGTSNSDGSVTASRVQVGATLPGARVDSGQGAQGTSPGGAQGTAPGGGPSTDTAAGQ
jgi:hypothetical protein